MIAEAGGAHYPAFETTVHLTRNHREAAASLQRVVDRPEENIFIYPGDNIYVSRDPKTFTVLGASTKVGRYNFGSETLNLAEAVAEGGGFVDAASDPAGVFVFRYEPLKFVNSLRREAAPTDADPTPVIYRLNLREGGGYFRARRFAMRDKDIILIANSDGAQLLKFAYSTPGSHWRRVECGFDRSDDKNDPNRRRGGRNHRPRHPLPRHNAWQGWRMT